MKILSLKQPFAELILQGRKKIELRPENCSVSNFGVIKNPNKQERFLTKWNTNFRGEFLIHASKNSDKDAMEKFGFKEIPLGAVLGKAELVGVKEYKNEQEHNQDKSFHLASIDWGNYGFLLKDPIRLDNPISCKSKLNFFDLDLKLDEVDK